MVTIFWQDMVFSTRQALMKSTLHCTDINWLSIKLDGVKRDHPEVIETEVGWMEYKGMNMS